MLLEAAGSRNTGLPARLAYCLNLHAATSLDEVLHVLRTYTAPLRERILGPGSSEPFGVGMYFEAPATAALSRDPGKLESLALYMAEARLDPFTFNAFPYGGFQADGLKERVYAPTWETEERLSYTVDVARVAAGLQTAIFGGGERFLSISTHPGAYGADITDRSGLRRCAENMGRAVGELAKLETETGHRIVLALESEPDASARNSRALAEYRLFAGLVGSRVLQDEFGASIEASGELMQRHLGTCLDCCHSAVEYESAEESLELATHGGSPLGKIQFSSALRLDSPAAHPDAVAALLALDEPRFLHQVTGRSNEGAFLHLPDLSALQSTLGEQAESSIREEWEGAESWRCHFHVPVDLTSTLGLATTRAHADEVLGAALAKARSATEPTLSPEAWNVPELHVELETYTWSVLPSDAAPEVDADGAVVNGLEAEYAHVLKQFERSGYAPVGSGRSEAD